MEIYIITNNVNGKQYVGKTTNDCHIRFEQHKKSSHDNLLTRAFKKYGKENFVVEKVCECSSKDELNIKEIEYIEKYDTYNNGYNMTLGGEGGDCGNQFTKNPETAKRPLDNLTEKQREEWLDTHRRGKNNPVHSRDVSGENNPNYGNKLSEEAKQRISDAKKKWHKNNKHPNTVPEVREKLRKSKLGGNNPKARKFSVEYPNGDIDIVHGLDAYCRP